MITKIMSLPYIIKLKGQIIGLEMVNAALKDDLKERVYKEYIQIKNESDINSKNKQIATLKQQNKELKQQIKELKKGEK